MKLDDIAKIGEAFAKYTGPTEWVDPRLALKDLNDLITEGLRKRYRTVVLPPINQDAEAKFINGQLVEIADYILNKYREVKF